MGSRKKIIHQFGSVSLLMLAVSGCSSNLERLGGDPFYTNSTAPQQNYGGQQSYPGDRSAAGRSYQATTASPQYVQPQPQNNYYQPAQQPVTQQVNQQVNQRVTQPVTQKVQQVAKPVEQARVAANQQLDAARAATVKPIDHSVNAGSKVQYQAPSTSAQQLNPAPTVTQVKPVQQETQVAALPAKPATNNVAAATDNIASFRWPAQGRVIAKFGQSVNGAANEGIDISLPEGTPVKATQGGTVIYSGSDVEGFGNLVIVRHANNWVSAYAHTSQVLVKRGDTVRRGQTIAKSGRTGNAKTPKLHFELRKKSTPVDPLRHLG